jgi:Na+-driven multidrug efflux pump
MFNILFLGYLVALLINPILVVLYALNKAHYLTFINLGGAALVISLNWILVPALGGIGSGLAFLISNFLGMIVGIAIVKYQINKL